MKTALIAGLTAMLTCSVTQADIIGTVDPATKTITFQGSIERLGKIDQYGWQFGIFETFSHASPPLTEAPLSIAGVQPAQFTLLEGQTSERFWNMILWDDDGLGDVSVPIVADPGTPYSYGWGSPAAIAGFESELAAGNIVSSNGNTVGTLTLTLKGAADTDGDGVPDDVDDCPDSDLSPTVWVGDCDSGVINLLHGEGVDEFGCSLADYVAGALESAAEDARNHGQFVRAMAHYFNELVDDEVLTWEEHEALMSCVAKMK